MDPLPILSSTSVLPVVGRQYSKFILAVGIAVAEQGLGPFVTFLKGILYSYNVVAKSGPTFSEECLHRL